MISSTWDKLWHWHEQVKDIFRFFTIGHKNNNTTNQHRTSETSSNGGGGDGKTPRTYKTGQLIGLILGPFLFIAILLFFRPEGLSREGCAGLERTSCMSV